MEYEEELLQLMKRDTGRGLLKELPAVDLEQVDVELSSAKRVIILTGFPVRCDASSDGGGKHIGGSNRAGGSKHIGGGVGRESGAYRVRGETDGPSGTANLAAALLASGCQVWIVTDRPSRRLLQAAVDHRAPGAQVICVKKHHPAAFAAGWMDRISPTHVISLERPGKSADGHFYNMRGQVIDDMVVDTEYFFMEAERRGIPTLAIGDGGNELGMGTFRQQICRFVPSGDVICAHQAADWTLPAGISNWWGWGLASLLSLRADRLLLPSEEEEHRMLCAVVEAGAVDGCTKCQEPSVDNMELSSYLKILTRVRELTAREIYRRRAAAGK